MSFKVREVDQKMWSLIKWVTVYLLLNLYLSLAQMPEVSQNNAPRNNSVVSPTWSKGRLSTAGDWIEFLYAECAAKSNRAEMKDSNKDERLCQLGKSLKTELKHTRTPCTKHTFASCCPTLFFHLTPILPWGDSASTCQMTHSYMLSIPHQWVTTYLNKISVHGYKIYKQFPALLQMQIYNVHIVVLKRRKDTIKGSPS